LFEGLLLRNLSAAVYFCKETHMAFGEWLERNPWTALLGASATVATASVGAATYFCTQQISLLEQSKNSLEQSTNSRIEQLTLEHEHEKNVLERYVNSIKRGINQDEEFDVRKLFVADDMSVEGVGIQESFEEGSFYAINDPDVWDYGKTNELDIARQVVTPAVYAQAESDYRAYGLESAAREAPAHFSKTKKVYRIRNNSMMAHAFAHISVQRLRTQQVADLALGVAQRHVQAEVSVRKGAVSEVMEAVAEGYVEEEREIEGQGSRALAESGSVVSTVPSGDATKKENQELLTRLSSSLRGDVVGFYLFSFLGSLQETNIATNDVVSAVINLEKLKNVAFISALMTLINPVVDGQRVDKFYIRRELIIAASREHVFIVNISTPTMDFRRRSDEDTAIAQWLDDLRIVATL
jgi:hypothetical protein